MGRCNNHVALSTIFKPCERGGKRVCSTRFYPEITRLNYRHIDFLPTGAIHLISDDVSDLGDRPVTQWLKAKYSCCDLLNKARACKQFMTDGFCIGRSLSKRFAE
jgi:hypothetical protein